MHMESPLTTPRFFSFSARAARGTLAGLVSLGLLAVVSFAPLAVAAAGEDEEEEEDLQGTAVIKMVDGIRFSVPDDRPIVRKDGLVVPLELDRYVALKFSKMKKRLTQIEDAIKKLKEDVDLVTRDVRSLKEKMSPQEPPR